MWTFEYDVRATLTWVQVVQVEAEDEKDALKEAKRIFQERFEDLDDATALEMEGDPEYVLNFGGPPVVSATTVLLHKDKKTSGLDMLELAQITGYPYIELLGQIFHATPGPNYGKHTGWKYMVRQGKFAALEVQDVRMPHLSLADVRM